MRDLCATDTPAKIFEAGIARVYRQLLGAAKTVFPWMGRECGEVKVFGMHDVGLCS